MATANKLAVMVRNFSSSNVTNQLVKPPVQIFGLEGRYACALYSAASKQKNLDAVEKELTSLQKTAKTDANFREFLRNPIVKRSIKSAAMKAVGTKISLSSQSSNLLQLLAENGRLNNLDNIINAFKTIMAAHRGEIVCEVTSAKPLDAAQQSQLEKTLKSFTKSSEKILLTTKVDPNILGGLIVSIGDKYVDMSVASKIKKYTELISAPV